MQFIYLHAYNAQYHVFPLYMHNVLTANGAANSCEQFYTLSNSLGNDVSPSSNLRIALSLLRAYLLTNTGEYLSNALDLLDAFSVPNTTAGLWTRPITGISPAHNSAALAIAPLAI